MAQTIHRPVFHLKLDEIREGQVLDSSGGEHHGEVHGNPEVVADETFGSCLNFDGVKDYLTIPDSSLLSGTPYTACVWIRADNLSTAGLIDRGDLRVRLLLMSGGVLRHERPNVYNDTAKNLIKKSMWMHVAFTNDGKSEKTYLNGTEVSTSPKTSTGSTPESRIIYIGRAAHKDVYYFKGQLSNIRIYNHALSKEMIRQLLEDDKIAVASFMAGHPIDFSLQDEDEQSVLAIDELFTEHDRDLFLDITNVSQQEITLDEPGKQASAATHHFP